MSKHTKGATHLEGKRLPGIDGLRGLFALVVVINHFVQHLGSQVLFIAADISVCAFFVLSGYVLCRGWDGHFGVFLARRFLRLWPVYALCLGAGYVIAGTTPVWTQFFWYPFLSADSKLAVDPPIWSLFVEAWAMLFMPIFVLARSGPVWPALAMAVASFILGGYFVMASFGMFFIAGAFLSRWEFRNSFLESAGPQWIGRISYSLYLSHWLVFEVAKAQFGDIGLVASFPVAFLVGWLVWRHVETPSIRLSRKVDVYFRNLRSRPAAIALAE